MRYRLITAVVLSMAALTGCGGRPPAATMAPPLAAGPQTAAPGSAGVYNWQDVPRGQQVPVSNARFDQNGYQIYAATGETILVPFVNQNLYVMKFGRSDTGQTYFVNDGDAPALYLPPGGYVENAAAQGARWYPIPNDFAYTRPVYVGLAPSWGDFVGMGWYPGMSYYGGMWGYGPHVGLAWMPGFYVNIGGTRYTSYNAYHSYYTRTPGYVRTTTVYNVNTPHSTGSFGSGRAAGTTGSFSTRRTGSFGGSGFGQAGSSTGSFGTGSRGRAGSSFGGGGSFGGSGRASGSSFGGTRSFGSSPRSSGGSFGGGGRSFSGGGSSFGGGHSSGSFGGRRRR